jgi:archaellin
MEKNCCLRESHLICSRTDFSFLGLPVLRLGAAEELTAQDVQDWTATLVGAERGVATMLDASEQMLIDITLPANTLVGYDEFTIQIIPPKGAAITIQRTLPGALPMLWIYIN